ncbi:hypothetical protein BH23ACT11_BH23ACT11_00490 [soil metagenome]
MSERAGDFEWHAEGDEAEIILYGLDDTALGRLQPASQLPGVLTPVYGVASSQNIGWISASATHVAPDCVSVPARGLLLIAEASIGSLSLQAEELRSQLLRNLSEVSLPYFGRAGLRTICEQGARFAADAGIIEEEDLEHFNQKPGDPDAVGRRALTAGERKLDLPPNVHIYSIGEVFDTEAAESMDFSSGKLAVSVDVETEELGRLAHRAHRDRIRSRILSGVDFDAEADLPAAPLGSEEAADLLAASHAAANFADGRTALTLYALRRAIKEIAGELRVVASWKVGGFEERANSVVHRHGLATLGAGETVVCGGRVARGTGALLGSGPRFDVAEVWPWEEAGLLDRIAQLVEL